LGIVNENMKGKKEESDEQKEEKGASLLRCTFVKLGKKVN
jgi:hypothetical protein